MTDRPRRTSVNHATTYAELAAEAQRQMLSSLERAQQLSLRGAELAAGLVPRDTGTRSVAKEAVDGAFAFAGQVLKQQHAYATRMTEIVAGSLGRAEPAPKPTE
jgi:hypothetical protein